MLQRRNEIFCKPWNNNSLVWCIAGVATLGVIVRPFGVPEFIWAVLGAAALVALGLLPWRDALAAAGKGTDVYLFLGGMMLLAEVARQEGLFDWLAALAVRSAQGSAKRLFLIVYGVGTLVTIFLSNDATAVVLTPAVYAAATAARVKPLPYLLVCAFIANAASFVLPISNPANLVIFGDHMPPLVTWLAHFTLPSIAAIFATYGTLRFTQRRALDQKIAEHVPSPPLSLGGTCVAIGIGLAAVALLAASAVDRPLGLPTFIAGLVVTIVVLCISRQSPLPIVRDISWGVLPLVAGLFILVEGVERTGILGAPRPSSAAGGRRVAPRRRFRRRHRCGLRLQSAEQPADRADCRHRQPERRRFPSGEKRLADRRRSRAEPLGDGLAGDHPVVDGAAPRRRTRDGLAIPEAGHRRHAARALARVGGAGLAVAIVE